LAEAKSKLPIGDKDQNATLRLKMAAPGSRSWLILIQKSLFTLKNLSIINIFKNRQKNKNTALQKTLQEA
jgi:hypothetical protein